MKEFPKKKWKYFKGRKEKEMKKKWKNFKGRNEKEMKVFQRKK